jgi:NCAIR mutase (PurE)-related protein
LDAHRQLRKGVPEVVYALRKTDTALEAIVRGFLHAGGLALVSRLEPARADRLRDALARVPKPSGPCRPSEVRDLSRVREASATVDDHDLTGLQFDYSAEALTLAAYTPAYTPPPQRGCVGVLTAGTSDIPVAEEAALVLTHMGCRVERAYDVGVAGIHRLLDPLARIIDADADALVVVAGMEGALPSVVAGLVDIPVIGVPTSTGYGLGGDGTGALCSILQSCSPGIVAVNIDNGVGAGATAGLIARRRAR